MPAKAFLVFHDAYGEGQMDVFEKESIEIAKAQADKLNNMLAENGSDDCGLYVVYKVLPTDLKIWSYTNLAGNRNVIVDIEEILYGN